MREKDILSRIPSTNVNMGILPDAEQFAFSFNSEDSTNKSKGTRYELYIGALYEKKGYSVEYNGINKGNRDGGIDLICKNDLFTVLVQCKCYIRCNITKKDICYFYGAVRYYAETHIKEVVKGAYWTTRKITPKHQVFNIINTLGITLYDCIGIPKCK